MTAKAIKITHDVQNEMFTVDLREGQAYIRYSRPEVNIFDLEETFVPEPARKKGIGHQMTRQVLDYLASSGGKVIPSCSFIEDFINSNTVYEDMVYTG